MKGFINEYGWAIVSAVALLLIAIFLPVQLRKGADEAFGNQVNQFNTAKGDPKENPTLTPDTFTIRWVNYDGTVLEVDENVEYGTVPTYDGEMPSKAGDVNTSYKFIGWSPTIVTARADATYQAYYRADSNFVLYLSNDSNHRTTVPAEKINGEEGVIYARVAPAGVSRFSTSVYPVTTETYDNGTYSGYTFAGWWKLEEDGTYSPYSSIPHGTEAFAKFVDDDVLKCYWQTEGTVHPTNEYATILFTTSIDSDTYKTVGIRFTLGNNSTVIKTDLEPISRYEGKLVKDAFCHNSITMFQTSGRIVQADFATNWTATPFVVTKDGTTVLGQSITAKITK